MNSETIVSSNTSVQTGGRFDHPADHILLLLDRSGSMSSIWGQTVASVKNFLSEQVSLAGRQIVADIYVFNNEYSAVYVDVPMTNRTVQEIKFPEPTGGTALLDAMGSLINDLSRRLREQSDLHTYAKPERVYFVTVTDGQENASKEWTQTLVKQRVQTAESWGWEFIYLGANQDAFSVANGLGISAANVSGYDTKNVGGAYAGVSSNILRSRSTGTAAAFSDDDRKAIGGKPTS